MYGHDGAGRTRERLPRWLKAPVVHFFAFGALLFVLIPQEKPVIIVRIDESALRNPHAVAEQGKASGHEKRVAQAIDDEILLREARKAGLLEGSVASRRLARLGAFVSEHREDDAERAEARARELGLDQEDVVIRGYAIASMRLAIEREADRPLPTEQDLEAHLLENADRFGLPERLRLRHVFVSSRHGGRSERRAEALLSTLRGNGPEAGVGQGDPFPHGYTALGSLEDLGRRFAPQFAAALDPSAVGRWQGPIPSAYGWHLVFLEERLPARRPSVAEVRGQLAHHLLRERRARHLRRRLDALRDGYEIRVEYAMPDPETFMGNREG